MKLRAALLAAAVASTMLATASHAGAPKSCKLLTDPAGDAYGNGYVKAGPNDDTLDVIGGDFASNAKSVTGIIRLKKFSATDQYAPLGRVWYLDFNVQGVEDQLWVAAGIYPNVTQFEYGYLDTTVTPNALRTIGTATGTIDTAKNEIRVTAPVKFGDIATVTPGKKITGIAADTRRFTGQNAVGRPSGLPSAVPFYRGLVSQIDLASATKSYVAGAASCVAVGK